MRDAVRVPASHFILHAVGYLVSFSPVVTGWFDPPSGTLLPFLTQLEVMNLSWNDLLGGSLKALSVHMQHVGKLKVLKLSGCRLTAEDLAALGEGKAVCVAVCVCAGRGGSVCVC